MGIMNRSLLLAFGGSCYLLGSIATISCGSDEPSSWHPAGGASGGSSGASGTSGAAGETASGGTGGTAGEAGGAGNAGQAGSSGEGGSAGSGGGIGDIWVNAYYAAWMQEALPPNEIRFEALSHVTHFAFVPNADGTLNTSENGMSEQKSDAIVQAAHAAGKKVLISIGGAGSHEGFRQSIQAARRDTFVQSILAEALSRGYDGIDIDMEPIEPGDVADFAAFVKALRAAADSTSPGLLLTAAASSDASAFAQVQDQLDQINIMTYDLSGTWEGWETWHNTPLFDGGLTFQSTGGPLPSCDGLATSWAAAGIDKSKLGIGIDFYGYVWHGADGPNQSIAGVVVDSNVSYEDIMSTYFSPSSYRWHDGVEAPYLSLGASGSATAKFVSYDDEESCTKKIEYVRGQGLGGVILWELGGGYRSGEPAGQRDLLLQAVGAAAFPK